MRIPRKGTLDTDASESTAPLLTNGHASMTSATLLAQVQRLRSQRLAVGPAQRQKLVDKLRKEASLYDRQALTVSRLAAARYRGEAVGLRRAIPLLLTPSYPPFERLEPWEIAEKLINEARRLDKQVKTVNRLQAQIIYGEVVGMRRAARMVEQVLR